MRTTFSMRFVCGVVVWLLRCYADGRMNGRRCCFHTCCSVLVVVPCAIAFVSGEFGGVVSLCDCVTFHARLNGIFKWGNRATATSGPGKAVLLSCDAVFSRCGSSCVISCGNRRLWCNVPSSCKRWSATVDAADMFPQLRAGQTNGRQLRVVSKRQRALSRSSFRLGTWNSKANHDRTQDIPDPRAGSGTFVRGQSPRLCKRRPTAATRGTIVTH